ncbi:MAG TPA: thiamine pyrophosphate-binding protein [Candidatus Acidoferrales bacterium]|nr:thiamine pyrophosphate-binding protein [Candidatus Acidoferrales bacterium]
MFDQIELRRNETTPHEVEHSATPRSGGRILADAVRIHGVDRVFCVPGESYLDVLDALHDMPEIQIVVAKHEGAAANMAEADGRLTGRPGICFVTRGPGATHASVGVHTAFQSSTPMILFVGQVKRSVRGRDAFQEVDLAECFAPLAKWTAEIDAPARIPEILMRAFQCATSGRPGPVVLSLPEDVLAEKCDVADVARFTAVQAVPNAAALDAFRAELARSQRPVMILGGSGWSEKSCGDLQAFVEANQLPVMASFRRQDLLNNEHPCYAGHLSLGLPQFLAERVRAADLLIALGTRLGDVTTSGYSLLEPPTLQQRLIHVHADPNELNRVYQADLQINSGPANFAAALAALPKIENPVWSSWTQEARQQYLNFAKVPAAVPPAGVNLAAVVSYLSERLAPGDIVSNGAGNYAIWVHRFFKYKRFGTELSPVSGAMGYGVPAAVAAKLRFPDRLSVCFSGDGCFLMYPQELATALQHNAAVIVLVVNNGMYGTIRMHQEIRFPGRISGTELKNPDFVALASAFGAYAERVESTGAFADAFERAVESRRPALLELCVDPSQITPERRL